MTADSALKDIHFAGAGMLPQRIEQMIIAPCSNCPMI